DTFGLAIAIKSNKNSPPFGVQLVKSTAARGVIGLAVEGFGKSVFNSHRVYLHLNEKEPNPNPFINLITALPMPDAQDSERARQLLRALAAQVQLVMKAHGL
ncbi:hypothetical protein Ac2012v2_002446, partial [Leucoagaricus gongylophorus]